MMTLISKLNSLNCLNRWMDIDNQKHITSPACITTNTFSYDKLRIAHYSDVIIITIMASPITDNWTMHWRVNACQYQRKYHSSTSLGSFVSGIHRWPVVSLTKARNAESVSMPLYSHDLLTCVMCISPSPGLYWFIFITRSFYFWQFCDVIFRCFCGVFITTRGSRSFRLRYASGTVENVVSPVTTVICWIEVESKPTWLSVDSPVHGIHVDTDQIVAAAAGVLVVTVLRTGTFYVHQAWNQFALIESPSLRPRQNCRQHFQIRFLVVKLLYWFN